MAREKQLRDERQIEGLEEEPAEQGQPDQEPVDPLAMDTEGPPSQASPGEPSPESLTQRYDQTGGWSQSEDPGTNFGGATSSENTLDMGQAEGLPDRFADPEDEGLADPAEVLDSSPSPLSGPNPEGLKTQPPSLTDEPQGSGSIQDLADVSSGGSVTFADGSSWHENPIGANYFNDPFLMESFSGEEADKRFYEKKEDGVKVTSTEGDPTVPLIAGPEPEPAQPDPPVKGKEPSTEPKMSTTDDQGNVTEATIKGGTSIQLENKTGLGGGQSADGISTPVEQGTYTDVTGEAREFLRATKEQVIHDDPDGHLINPERLAETQESNPLVEEQKERSGIANPTDDGTGQMGSGAQNPPGGYTDPAQPDDVVITDGVYEDIPDIGLRPDDGTVDLGLQPDDSPDYQIAPEFEEIAASRVPDDDSADDDLADDVLD